MSRHNVLIEHPVALALSPVLLAQAAWAMARTPRLPEPEGARHGVVGDGPPLNVLVLGDSSAAGVGVPVQEAALGGQLALALSERHQVRWQVVARSGATTAKTREMLADTASQFGPVDVAVTALGVNDVKNGVRLTDWLSDTQSLHEDLRANHGAKQIIVSGLPPLKHFPVLKRPLSTVLHQRALRFEAALVGALTASKSDALHLPFDLPMTADVMAEDGFHPGPVIYREWAARVAARIATNVGENA